MKKLRLTSLVLSVLIACSLIGCKDDDTTPTDKGITAGDNVLFADTVIGNGSSNMFSPVTKPYPPVLIIWSAGFISATEPL